MRFLMQYKIYAKGRHLTKNTQHIRTTQAHGLFQFQNYRISMLSFHCGKNIFSQRQREGRGGVGQGAWSQSRVTTVTNLVKPSFKEQSHFHRER